ncbi:CocE/NonD family hydrolase [Sphingomonas sp. MMS24-JH45]
MAARGREDAAALPASSGGRANGLGGDGRLDAAAPPAGEAADRYSYDPANPVQTIGGGDCCNGGLVTAGAFDQRPIEARDDVLVYTSDPMTKPTDVSGFVKAVLKVSSDARDTDFAVKLVDVTHPDGTAYILGDTILRARYRDGYAAPVMMARGRSTRCGRRRSRPATPPAGTSHPGGGDLVQTSPSSCATSTPAATTSARRGWWWRGTRCTMRGRRRPISSCRWWGGRSQRRRSS